MAPARLGAIVLAVVYCGSGSPATGDEGRRRICFLESLAPGQPAAIRTIDAFKRRLGEKTAESFEIFIDYMELERLPGEAHIDQTVRYLQAKYAQAPPAVLIPLGRAAVPFMLQHRKAIAPEVPVIMTSVPARAARDAAALDNAVWVVTDYDFAKTFELARRLQPAARRVAVIGGSSDYDRQWLDDARRDLAPYRDRYELTYLVDLVYDELLAQAARLPPGTIVLMSFVFEDGKNVLRTPPDVAAAVSAVSAAPVYAPISTFFGQGIVGGYMDTYEEHGVAAADLALEILSGKSIVALDQFTRPLHQYRVDARQLERWGFSEKRLPPGTVVAFRTPTVWDEHRDLVIGAALVVTFQSGLVVTLLIHRRRRRSAELQLKESEERLLSTAASANVGLWQLERKSNDFWMTEHCRELLCLPEGAPLTRESLMASIHPGDREIASSLLETTAAPGHRELADVRIVAPDGKVRWIRIRTRVENEGRAPRRSSGVFVDMTEQKAAEADAALRYDELAQLKRVREREGRLATMTAMSASIAHELSQPIGAMMASADAALVWLEKTPSELPNVRTSVERIASEGRRASDVIASVRSLFRRDGGGHELVDVNGIVREVLAIEHDELQRRGVVAKLELASIASVSFDRIQLHQVVINLVTNAIEAMSTVVGRPHVLRVKTACRPPGEIVIAVEDSGIGIERDRLDRIFEPFFTTKARGMGLGLWLCRRIVENHRGRLTASSEVGRGSRFEIVLPNAEAAAVPASEAASS